MMIPMLGTNRVMRAAAAAIFLLGVAQTAAAQLRATASAIEPAAAQGRLLTRRVTPRARVTVGDSAGLRALSVDSGRTVLLYVPAGYRADRPAPVLVMLHGASGNPRRGLSWVMPLADSAGVILLAPQSQGLTWDVVRGRYGPDVAFVDHALAYVLARYAVDTTRLAIGGFSDGATYALSLGITNGDLFSHVIAFSPGFMVPAAQRGEPRLFVSHGTRDQVLSIDACSRRIVARVRDAGYDVRYREFDGGHTVPPSIAREALAWLAGEWGERGGGGRR
jgi:phospholipase/carboxylesterase